MAPVTEIASSDMIHFSKCGDLTMVGSELINSSQNAFSLPVSPIWIPDSSIFQKLANCDLVLTYNGHELLKPGENRVLIARVDSRGFDMSCITGLDLWMACSEALCQFSLRIMAGRRLSASPPPRHGFARPRGLFYSILR